MPSCKFTRVCEFEVAGPFASSDKVSHYSKSTGQLLRQPDCLNFIERWQHPASAETQESCSNCRDFPGCAPKRNVWMA
jgi:hypothetical protein